MSLAEHRQHINQLHYADNLIPELIDAAKLTPEDRQAIVAHAVTLVEHVRNATDPGLLEIFLAQYELSTDEGVALMCLAEALLRVPDAETIDDLIEDKIAPSDWGQHLGGSASSLVNASTWALLLTGHVLDDEASGISGALRSLIRRVGEPAIRVAVAAAIREMGRQFVLGEDITAARKRAAGMEAKGFTYSYDMLGEAARTDADAKDFHLAYSKAIAALAEDCVHDHVAQNPGISVKLSALHPRYEVAKRARVMDELVPRLRSLAVLAKSAGMGLNVDAEEADRLDLSLDVMEQVLRDPGLAGWGGFGIVVQAYGPRAGAVIDWVYTLAQELQRPLMVRLVKGAYWDSEIKHAQVEGQDGFPVFTTKAATDISYIALSRKLLSMTDYLYPQFATHNAHTIAAVSYMAQQMTVDTQQFEFQRLHGMGETLHTHVLQELGTHCRIYAPVGAHEDLLAYLVRRLLENGANSSFVNKVVDADIPPAEVVACPFTQALLESDLPTGRELFAPQRSNSKGWDLSHPPTLIQLEAARTPFKTERWEATQKQPANPTYNPGNLADLIGSVAAHTAADVNNMIQQATPWDIAADRRSGVLLDVADAFEANAGELFALLAREAGKTLPDAIAELREAVDFLRYYASCLRINPAYNTGSPRGIWACISPWNFPLAIFTGQIAAALAAGNAVIAKPAPQTPLIARRAVELFHAAGIPHTALQLAQGGTEPGAALTKNNHINGVAFTGSTATAKIIHQSMAKHLQPGAPLIAETGGINAMLVDSSALPEHAVRDIIASAFQSAGQRCSALRCLYVQEEIAPRVIALLKGAMDELQMGDPWLLETDIGPVIDAAARDKLVRYVNEARTQERVLHELTVPDQANESGYFVAPTLIQVDSINDLVEEMFGPVLHIATFSANELETVLATVNQQGYGLTFGVHTRIDDRVQLVVDQLRVGNIYVNRNQIGAVVGSQPFGGEGLSGTGPKAGGPSYMAAFFQAHSQTESADQWHRECSEEDLIAALTTLPPATNRTTADLPGPTGESNRLSHLPRAPFICAGPGEACAQRQLQAVKQAGGTGIVATGQVAPESLLNLAGIGGVMWWGEDTVARAYAEALADRPGPILPLITTTPSYQVVNERHVCIDTTAAGGNVALLAQSS